ncbi:MAG: NAD-dependent isocitrate dehydrogenase [Fimbriimonadia bacterium]|nr:NAD-dependent isocitrate dehydrogenase [Fimbriimonadia bacterium]
MDTQTITLIRGDGIGPEITEAVVEIFEAAHVPVQWEEAEAGLACAEKHGTPLPKETVEKISRNKIALKGPTTTPSGTGHKSVNVTIRKTLDLFANVRPAKSLPGVRSRYDNVDLLLVRENIEDTYAGVEHWQTPDVAQCLKVITRPGSLAVINYAFAIARAQGRKRVTCVHKANIHKITDGLFLECFREAAQHYPDLQSDDILIDNACMQLVIRPEQFDVMILPNLYGDIVSDLCAGLVGGLGVAPGGNIGDGCAVFEAVHGSAPDIAGQGIANPTAILLSAIQMLRHIGLNGHAGRIETALRYALVSGIKTRDMGGNATTREFTRAIISGIPSTIVSPNIEEKLEINPLPLPEARDSHSQGWHTVGVDLFVHENSLPHLPETVGKMTLAMISNRGTKVYPGSMPFIYLVNWYRARYLSETPLHEEDLQQFFNALPSSVEWTTIQRLNEDKEGNPMFSKAQGEE